MWVRVDSMAPGPSRHSIDTERTIMRSFRIQPARLCYITLRLIRLHFVRFGFDLCCMLGVRVRAWGAERALWGTSTCCQTFQPDAGAVALCVSEAWERERLKHVRVTSSMVRREYREWIVCKSRSTVCHMQPTSTRTPDHDRAVSVSVEV